MKEKVFFLLFTVFISVPCVFSIPLESLISTENAVRLRLNDAKIMETQLRNPLPKLLPNNDDLRRFITMSMNTVNPNMMIETLYLYRKPEHSYTDSFDWDELQKAGLFNQMVSIGTLAGIQYYSASRGTMRTFFEYSQIIDGPNTKNPLPDPVFETPPARLSLFARQKDLTFGDNIYRYEYVTSDDMIFFVQENITSLSVTLLPAIGRGNLRTVLAVFDCGDLLLVYVVSIARTASVPGLGERISNSFSNRMEAIMKWFAGRMD
ncbi:MAG: hypothetical protein LBI12_04145, partial [Treponema sp.]|nr:hypothetical protein [Treponema sp.]